MVFCAWSEAKGMAIIMTGLVVQSELNAKLATGLLLNEPMHKHTSWHIGGPAEYFIEPKDTAIFKKCILLAKELALPLTIIGKGTNLLVLDSGIPGLVLKLGPGFKDIKIIDTQITVGAGALLPTVAQTALQHNLAGFAWVAGIPGSIGGAVVMNAGAHGCCISEIIQSVKIINEQGQIFDLAKEQLFFGYRTSILKDDRSRWVVEATFNCWSDQRQTLAKQMKQYLAKRRQVQPQGYPNAGSVFKNPSGESAGKLIELAGCKGIKVGQAQVSEIHANWIVNLGNATAKDVITLINIIKNKVKEKFNITLQLEVRVLG